MTAEATHRAIEATFRIERARLIAGLARVVRDLDLAEELAQDALIVALADWPARGIPDRPGAWLMTVAKRRALDGIRHRRMRDRKHAAIGCDADDRTDDEDRANAAIDDDLGDELLGLIFTACHPILPVEARVALTLRIVAGLTTDEIARAFLAREPAIAQRIVRAKKTIAQARLAFEVPRGADRAARLAAVLEVVYLVFNEGYAATAGEALIRADLCAEAQRLGRILVGLMPGEAETAGLLALMELQASRLPARVGPDGAAVSLLKQDRSRWDRLLVARGLATLERSEALADGRDAPYRLQAALAACHARAPRADDTDWTAIAVLYDRLGRIVPGPVVELNRAIAYGMAQGPAVGLQQLDAIADIDLLRHYAPLPAARGDCLFRLGRLDEAQAEFEAAAGLTRNQREAAFLLARAGACSQL